MGAIVKQFEIGLIEMKKHGKHGNKFNRQRVIAYWLAMAEYEYEQGNYASADECLLAGVWCEQASNSKFQRQCKVWYQADQEYWASLPQQQTLLAA